MSETPDNIPAGDETRNSALFSNLLMQQFSMAMMLMGRSQPPGGHDAPPKDLEAARLFIDQLEMLETKTKGNLTKEEESLLKQTLMTLRMSFVDAVEEAGKETKPDEKSQEQAKTDSAGAPASAAAQEESHKKFSKKY
jgi:hypothetical protein